jgi:hypothetical protein
LKAKLGDDSVDGAFADPEVALPEFLSDDLSASLGIQESMADDLADQFLGTAVVGSRATLATEKRLAALLEEESPELEVTLTAKAEFGSGTVNAFGAAFTLDEHGELACNFVIIANGKGAELTLDAFFEKFEGNHRDLLERVPQLV